ncbi:MAG: TerC family protein [Candidatus Sumerlaeaceae bacterium]
MDNILHALSDPQAWVALLTLTLLEIVLGIDNIVFISILAGKLPIDQQKRARTTGLMLAMVMRIILLLCITWVMGLTRDLFRILGQGISGKDLILIGGGLFLIGKATREIHEKLEGAEEEKTAALVRKSFWAIIIQIILIDIVFSLDSVITAVGMAKQLWVMIAAVVIAVAFMLVFAGLVSRFVDRHPTVKMLALSFLVLIGVNLIAEGCGQHIPKGYTYFAMAFAVAVESLNLRLRKATPEPVHLRQRPL